MVDLREGLRELLLANNGGPLDPPPSPRSSAAARRWPSRSDADGRPGSSPSATASDAALGRLLAIVAEAQAGGHLEPHEGLPAEDCHWAFYDSSRNRSRTWCSMSVCGNRAKARSYRARARHD